MKLIFINRYFYPDTAPTSQLLADLAFALAAHGHEVTVLTSRQLYTNSQARLPTQEAIAGVQIRRVWSSRFGRAGLLGRAGDYLTFYFSITLALLRIARPGLLVIPKTDPPLMGVLAAWICRLRGATCLHWLQDIFPEIAEALGLRLGFWGRWLAARRDASLKHSLGAVVIGQDMLARLQARGIRADKLHVIPNWADATALQPQSGPHPQRTAWGWETRLVVGYAGNLGRAHELDTLITALIALADDPRIGFVFSGGGAGWQRLRRLQAQHGWTHVRFLPYQPLEKLAALLSLSDVHLVSLRAGLEGWLVPSKFYASLAVARPVLYLGPANSEVAQQVLTYHCGWQVTPGQSEALLHCLRQLDQATCQAAGQRGRAALLSHWDKPHALARWQHLLAQLEQTA